MISMFCHVTLKLGGQKDFRQVPAPLSRTHSRAEAIRTTVVLIRILIRTTVVPITPLIGTTVGEIRIIIGTTGI